MTHQPSPAHAALEGTALVIKPILIYIYLGHERL
jgi:hypothetical protein